MLGAEEAGIRACVSSGGRSSYSLLELQLAVEFAFWRHQRNGIEEKRKGKEKKKNRDTMPICRKVSKLGGNLIKPCCIIHQRALSP